MDASGIDSRLNGKAGVADGFKKILCVNGGSSSIKLALYEFQTQLEKIAETELSLRGVDRTSAIEKALAWLSQQSVGQPDVIAHRVVHGGPNYFQPTLVNDAVLTELERLSILDPSHMEVELALIKRAGQQFGHTAQLACFDTAFHHNMPRVASLLPLPRQLLERGIRRYGFHGLSCSFILQKLHSEGGEAHALGRLIIAHLGSGVSLTAVEHGHSVDTTMSLTPLSGLPMSTRLGDIDPGLVAYLHQTEGVDPLSFSKMAANSSGLLGVSAISGDMKQLLDIENENLQAAEAIELFCYSVKKQIGAYAAALGGLDGLIFTGGIGEQAPSIRSRICDDLQFLGIVLNQESNIHNASLISNEDSVPIRVIHTDEAYVMAQAAQDYLNAGGDDYATD